MDCRTPSGAVASTQFRPQAPLDRRVPGWGAGGRLPSGWASRGVLFTGIEGYPKTLVWEQFAEPENFDPCPTPNYCPFYT